MARRHMAVSLLFTSLILRTDVPEHGNSNFIILSVCCQQIIYDIGTNILCVQCFVTTDMFLFCKPIFL